MTDSERKRKDAAYQLAYYHSNKEKAVARMRAYRANNKQAIWAALIKRTYGLTVEQFDAMFTGHCHICEAVVEAPLSGGARVDAVCIDHCHKTGKVRGLLCHGCNRGLGLFGENTHALRAAADYLEKQNGE